MPEQTDQPSLETLVDEARQGSRRALDEVVRRIQGRVYGLALRMLFLPADAEDAAQEILIKVITNLQSFRGEGRFEAWVLRIGVNHLLAARKSRAERLSMSLDAAQALMDKAQAQGWFSQPLEAPEPLVEMEMRAGCTQGMLLCLDRPHRAAFILGVVLDLPGREAAEALGISQAAYRKRLSRARRRVCGFLRGNCGLIDPANPCTCAAATAVELTKGWLDPAKPVFTKPDAAGPPPESLGGYMRELDEMGRVAALFKSLPTDDADFVPLLREILGRGGNLLEAQAPGSHQRH